MENEVPRDGYIGILYFLADVDVEIESTFGSISTLNGELAWNPNQWTTGGTISGVKNG
jgi:hypothetical protein